MASLLSTLSTFTSFIFSLFSIFLFLIPISFSFSFSGVNFSAKVIIGSSVFLGSISIDRSFSCLFSLSLSIFVRDGDWTSIEGVMAIVSGSGSGFCISLFILSSPFIISSRVGFIFIFSLTISSGFGCSTITSGCLFIISSFGVSFTFISFIFSSFLSIFGSSNIF